MYVKFAKKSGMTTLTVFEIEKNYFSLINLTMKEKFIVEPYPCSSKSDLCAYKKSIKQSQGPGDYMTGRPIPGDCFMNRPGRHPEGSPGRYIDAESELSLRPYRLSHCPENKFQKMDILNCDKCQNCDKGMPCGCHHCSFKHNFADCKEVNALIPENSRGFKACMPIEQMVIHRWDPISMDIQNLKYIQDNSYIGINTRDYSKKKHEQS
jgi:hypothetical protein